MMIMIMNAAAKPELTPAAAAATTTMATKMAVSTSSIAKASAVTTVTSNNSNDTSCSYPGKKCTAARALKPNGTLHKLCELHRRRANLNQKRLQQKRRLLRDKLFKRANGLASGAGKTTACDMLYTIDAIDAPRSPTTPSSMLSSSTALTSSARVSSSYASSVLSSPASMDALTPAPMSYTEQVEYLFADPLLQQQPPQQQSFPFDFVPEFSCEDVYMLQAALFNDVNFSSAAMNTSCAPQFAWHAML